MTSGYKIETKLPPYIRQMRKKKFVSQKFDYDWNWFSRNMLTRSLWEGIEWRLENNLTSFLGYTGIPGSGKSNGGLYTCMRFDETWKETPLEALETNFYLGKDTDLTLDYISDRHDKGDWVLVDEAELVIQRMRATSEQTVEATHTFDIVRDHGVNFVLTMPRLSRISKAVAEDQLSYNVIFNYNNQNEKYTRALARANVITNDQETYGYVNLNPSWVSMPYVDIDVYQAYKKIKEDKVYSKNYNKTFREARSERLAQEQKEETLDAMEEWLKIIKDDLEQFDVTKRDSDTIEAKVRMAQSGLKLDLDKKQIKGVLRCGDALIGRAEAENMKERIS